MLNENHYQITKREGSNVSLRKYTDLEISNILLLIIVSINTYSIFFI